MIKVSIIGSGNVAQHLIKAFLNTEFNDGKIELIEAYARNVSALTDLLAFDKITNDLSLLKPADLFLQQFTGKMDTTFNRSQRFM